MNTAQTNAFQKRQDLIRQIQNARGSKVLVYITGDRQPFLTQIADDAVRFLYDHLLAMGQKGKKVARLDLFLYSRGGDVSVPWRIVTMIREFCDEFAVLVPYKAHSAATMIALGADKIIMGRKAELGPIDPSLVGAPGSGQQPPQISVEDVTSYVSFMRERANINDQSALARVISQLANHVTPLALGSVNRQYSHIRLVARKLLSSHNERLEDSRMAAIIEALTEKIYSHGHAIARKEAAEMGLPVEEPDDVLESLIWQLFLEYENFLHLHEPLDPAEFLITNNAESHTEQNIPCGVIESENMSHVFEVNTAFRWVRRIPPNPQINVGLNVSLPPGIANVHNQQQLDQIVQAIMAQIQQQIPAMVQQEIVRQSPIVGVDSLNYGGKWRKIVP